jgi:vacuolar-type H+-ATPase subunit E/Vma4
MADTQVMEKEKLSRFEKDVNSRIDLKISELEAATIAQADNIVKDAEDKALNKAFDKIQNAVKFATSEYMKNVTLNESECHHKTLIYREKIVDGIFEELKKKIIDFSKSAEYKDYLLKKLKSIKIEKETVVLLAEKDKALVDTLKKEINAEYEFDSDIKIGGFSLKNGSFIQNFSLDQALADQRRNFSKNYKLN